MLTQCRIEIWQNSSWNWLIGFDYTNPVICELEVRPGYIQLWHVTGRTLLFADRASCGRPPVSPGFTWTPQMTSQALGVIETRIVL